MACRAQSSWVPLHLSERDGGEQVVLTLQQREAGTQEGQGVKKQTCIIRLHILEMAGWCMKEMAGNRWCSICSRHTQAGQNMGSTGHASAWHVKRSHGL
jgi:hypothetical protein